MDDPSKRCKAKTKDGKPCRAAATEGGLCFFHANPNKATELGRIGGRKNRHFVADGLDPLPKIETAREVQQTVARLIADVYAGKLHPRIAAGLAPLLSLQLRAIQTTNIEERIAKLERSMGRLESGDSAGVGHGRQETPESFQPLTACENNDPNEHEAL
jgi:hypothetical protein